MSLGMNLQSIMKDWDESPVNGAAFFINHENLENPLPNRKLMTVTMIVIRMIAAVAVMKSMDGLVWRVMQRCIKAR